MDNKTGKFILSLRQEKGLSQYQLAEMIPISRQAVSKWERGENIPDSYTLLKLSELFNVTINELLLGERQLDNSVESLEKTTLTILDQSNKKSKKIKRMLIIFTTIITVLLLSFLSYYFITSYNSIKVYMVGGDNTTFNTNNGMLITTKEKYYLKIGKIRYKDDITINSIQLCYKDNNKEKIIADDLDIDNLNIWDNYGYSEKNIKYLKKSYLKINYNDNKISKLYLLFNKDFANSSLFKKKNKNWKEDNNKTKNNISKEELKEEVKEEESKEEEKKEETTQEPAKKEETKPVVNDTPVEEEITIEKIINKIKEKGTYSDEGYFYETTIDGNTITYMNGDEGNQIMMFDSFGDYWDYDGRTGRFSCIEIIDNDLCQNYIYETAKKHLFN